MAKDGKRGGCIKWLLVVLAVFALAIAALYIWATNNDSVATLDRLDSLFGSRDTELVAGPVAFGDGDEQVLYVHRAPGDDAKQSQPVLVWIHGGAWRDGDPKDYAYIGRSFAPEGYVVVNFGYRKSDGGKFPAMLEDGAAGVRWVVDNIDKYCGDPQRIYLMGHSAGAYNAVMLGLDPQWLGREGLGDDAIDGVIGLAGPYDFAPFDGESTIRTFGDHPDVAATQPINFTRGDAPPMLLMTGTEDTVVQPRNSRVLGEKLREAGAEATVTELAGQNHADIIVTLARPFDRDARAKETILEWLAEREAAAPPSALVQGEEG